MGRDFRWLPHTGRRHAISTDLLPGDTGQTLCALPLIVPRRSPPKTDWCWPTCPDCDLHWRRHEGIPPYPRPHGHPSTQALQGAPAPRQSTTPTPRVSP
ncbi:zinc finger protein [Saccharothrix coeruleofusca]|uniref:zinc finger protein n=1 Tax=Saccharothrix coeruleofusca TaxID=33919 RepID=UPI0016716290|nr:zinc finger protein [Saccharothrix coeruleofusca]